jgi:cobalt/nickel transport system ATP-binding protein
MDVIRATNLSYTYPDGTEALKDIDFRAEKGECVALLGPNGAGKSTLLQLFNGLLTPSEGEVLVNGQKTHERGRLVGMVFQNPDDQLFELTVGRDVAYGPTNLRLREEAIQERVKEGLSLVHMEGCEDKAINSLSYGEKKRVAIAGVLAMWPEILALDEPTLGLDPVMASDIVRLLLKLKQASITMVVATHDVDAVPLFADRIYVLNKGRVLLEGPPKEVFKEKEKIRASNLRLPRIAHLFEVLRREEMPLTIGQARRLLEDGR